MKRKIGTVLDDEMFTELKTRAAKEKRSISDLFHEALARFLREDPEAEDRRRAMDRVMNPPLRIDRETMRQIMDEDFYDQ
jgi:plasmid stability protein